MEKIKLKIEIDTELTKNNGKTKDKKRKIE